MSKLKAIPTFVLALCIAGMALTTAKPPASSALTSLNTASVNQVMSGGCVPELDWLNKFLNHPELVKELNKPEPDRAFLNALKAALTTGKVEPRSFGSRQALARLVVSKPKGCTVRFDYDNEKPKAQGKLKWPWNWKFSIKFKSTITTSEKTVVRELEITAGTNE